MDVHEDVGINMQKCNRNEDKEEDFPLERKNGATPILACDALTDICNEGTTDEMTERKYLLGSQAVVLEEIEVFQTLRDIEYNNRTEREVKATSMSQDSKIQAVPLIDKESNHIASSTCHTVLDTFMDSNTSQDNIDESNKCNITNINCVSVTTGSDVSPTGERLRSHIMGVASLVSEFGEYFESKIKVKSRCNSMQLYIY